MTTATGIPAAPSPPSQAKALVEAPGGRQRLGIGVIALVLLGITLLAIAHVAVHAKRIEVAIALGKQEQAFRELNDERRHLEIEIGMLKDPARIIAIARDQLRMHPPAPENIHAAKPAGKGARKP